MTGRRTRWLIAGALSLLLIGLDLGRPPRDQLTGAVLIAAIDGYRAFISPGLQSAGVRCRFRPSCSHYALDAIRSRGALVGSALTAWRLLRCGPWTAAGTVDPPPEMLD